MFILLLMICLLTGCKTSEKKLAEESKEPVKISIILTVDPSTGTKNEQKVVEAFNKKYKGTYELDVDWIVETEADYRQNLKRLNATDDFQILLQIFECFLPFLSENDCRKPNCGSDSIY